MAVQKDHKLPLGRINRLTGPAARQPDELKEIRFEGVRDEHSRRRGPVVDFVERESSFGKTAVTVLVGLQSDVLHGDPAYSISSGDYAGAKLPRARVKSR